MILNGVEFFEDADFPKSPQPVYALERGQITRSLQFRPADGIVTEAHRFVCAEALLGYPQYVSGIANYIRRRLPDRYPAPVIISTGGLDYLWASAIAKTEMLGAPVGVDSFGAAVYPAARFTIIYTTPQYLIRPDEDVTYLGPLPGFPDEGVAIQSGWPLSRYVTRTWKAASETVTLPQGFMQRAPEAGVPTGAVSKGTPLHLARGMRRYVWQQVPVEAIPEEAIDVCFKGVNNATFDGAPLGTLLLDDVELAPYTTSFGQRLVDISYTMNFRPNYDRYTGQFRGWNSTYLPDNAKRYRFLYVTTDGLAVDFASSLNVAYPFVDFQSLFRPDQP